MAIFNINNGSFLNFTKGFGGFMMMAQGTAMAAQGARAAGDAAMATARYNASLVQFNLNRQLDQMGQQLRTLRATQTAQMGGSGLRTSSKSFLAIADSTLHNFEKELVQRKNSALVEQQGLLFEGASRQAAANREAQAIQSQGIAKAFNSLPSLLSQLSG